MATFSQVQVRKKALHAPLITVELNICCAFRAGKRFSMFRSFGIESAFNSATAEVQTVSRSAAKVVENAEKIQL